MHRFEHFCILRITLRVFVLCALSTPFAARAANAHERHPLVSGWEFRQTGGPQPLKVPAWHPASVPGDVHLDLLKNRLISSPFRSDNVARLEWIGDADWEYRNNLIVDAARLQSQHVDLVFDGLDTTAKVFLNGKPVLAANNMFREWRVDVKPYLHAGENTLTVQFPSSIREAAQIAAQDAWRNASHASTPVKTYLRKAAYEYGWDWGPRLLTCGMWREVRLETWTDARISGLFIAQNDIRPQVARLTAQVDIVAGTSEAASISLAYTGSAGPQTNSRNVTLAPGLNHITIPVEIVSPSLWYPAGYGKQAFYNFSAKLTSKGLQQDAASTRAGLRSVVLRREQDAWGRSFEFVVNGIPIFAKGASVVPFDSFAPRVTTADYRRILQAARDSNMNMVRQWGGGFYESDTFYDLCDELGLMVWQDFMFGNEWQPGTYSFRNNVKAEVAYQVERLRNHPSIVLWCGNNETEASWDWGRTVAMTGNNPETARHMWQNYLVLFSGDIAQTVERLDPAVPYWPSSPSADYEDTSGDFKMPGENNLASSQSYMSGDTHNYGVHAPSDYDKYFPRFLSEYGWMSFPEMQTIDSFTEPGDRTSISTPVMLAHQDGDDGNKTILNNVREFYGEPKDLPSLVYLSQLLQAEWVRAGAEHQRRNMRRTMGSLFWQLNDCWPAASLSSIDYYGRWKALQYYARRFYSPILVSPHVEDGALQVYVVSDKLEDTHASVQLRLLKADGTVLYETNREINIPRLSSNTYVSLPLEQIEKIAGGSLGSVVAATSVHVDSQLTSESTLFLVPQRHFDLLKPAITTKLVPRGSGYAVQLNSDVLARGVDLSFGDAQVTLSDNFFDLLPHETREIEVSSPETLDQLRGRLKVISMADTIHAR